ncbi:MAG: FkbM family methyltransferase [Zoogloeaceae bacterium]|jgi:FkbM family methyltransferase|nr:FkbM family methyltransferase [Zoogloeaceae bacterium]
MTTSSKFAALLQDCAWRPGPWPVLIYGAGDAGGKAAVELRRRGAKISGFIDIKAKPGQCLAGIPVSTLSDWCSRNDPAHHEVFIAISNPNFLPEIPEIRQKIAACGFAKITYHPREVSYIAMEDPVLYHFGNVGQCYGSFLPELSRLDMLLADEKSRQCLVDYVRANCQEEPVQNYSTTDRYCPADLPAWPQPLRMIDGGAFIGDTLSDFMFQGCNFDAVAVFEPDPENFKRLVLNTASCENIIRFPCALWNQTKALHFNANSTFGSHICGGDTPNTSTIFVQCVSLDDILPTFAPNLIKMDIEGAEPGALMGAKNMITRYRPHLAICLYHHVDHLWRIPLMIHEWNLGYRMYIRQHDPLLDLVLYAYPNKD